LAIVFHQQAEFSGESREAGEPRAIQGLSDRRHVKAADLQREYNIEDP
jgi:hypothetical protein